MTTPPSDLTEHRVGSLAFKVGAFTYTVHLARDMADEAFGRCDGLCAASDHTIWLDAGLDDEPMLAALRHEHAHAFQFSFGTPAGLEAVADFAASVGYAFDRDFTSQGGLAALKALPVAGPEARRRRPGRERRRERRGKGRSQ